MFKLKPIPSTLPLPIREEWDRLQKLQNDNYGLVFAVTDSYETVLKIILLSICYLLKENDEIDLIAGFRVKTPFSIFSLGSCQFRQRVHTRAFTGVERREKENEKDCVVYLTETGTVYHRSLDCSYLKLTISKVLYRDLVNLRNSSGGKYKICERCCHGITPQDGEEVYITIYGDRYHKSRTCSGLKRTIREIMLSQVGNRAPCSKCGGKEK